jgi:hypothetical protein
MILMSGSVISGVISHAITIAASAGTDTYLSPLTITAGGSVLAGSAGTAINFAGSYSLTNSGYVSGGAKYAVNGAQLLVNAGTIAAAAASDGAVGGTGVYVPGYSQLTNPGLIKGGAGLDGSSQAAGLGGDGVFIGGSVLLTGMIYGGNGGSSSVTAGRGGTGAKEEGSNAMLALNGGLLAGGQGGNGAADTGGYGGEGLQLFRGIVTGAGTITGGNGGASTGTGGQGGPGIYLANGIVSGTLDIRGGAGGNGAAGGRGGEGIQLAGSAGIVTGDETITGGAGGAATTQAGGTGGIGIYVTQGATITLSNDIVAGGAGGASAQSRAGTGGVGIELDSATLFGTGTITGGAYAIGDGAKGAGGVGLFITSVAYADLDAVITGGAGAYGVKDLFGNFVNTGMVQGGSGAAGAYVESGTLTNAGTISGTVAVSLTGEFAELIVDPGAVFSGDVEANFGENNILDLAGSTDATLTGIGTEFAHFSTIDFAAGSTWEVTGDLAGLAGNNGATIAGFAAGDRILLDNEVATGLAFSNDKLTLTGNSGVIGTLTIDEAASISSAYFQLSTDGTSTTLALNVNCFAAGTRILTLRGEVPVEEIEVDDEVVTLHDPARRSAKVIWTGRRSFDLQRLPDPHGLSPVRIAAGAFAPGVPARDVRLSPHHAIYWDGALFEALSLVNGTSIVLEQNCRFITYHHLEVEGHDVLLAEGLPAESYLETGGRDNFEAAVMRLHADFHAPADAKFCAPLIKDGAPLVALRAHLAQRSGRRRAG